MPREAYDRAEANGCFRSLSAADAGGLPEDVLESVLAEQEQDWITGKGIAAQERLRMHLALAADPAQAAQLVYHEFVLRQEGGEAPDWDDYLRRFPALAARLQQLRQADEIVGQLYPAAEAAAEPRPRLRDYELLEEIGHGGMGIVYKARQKSLDRVVAVKMMRAGESADTDQRRRFRREAEAVARLQHPNIVEIHEVGEAQGQPFLALEFIKGPSLAQHLKGTPLPARQAASLLETLARAMHYAHEQGIIHRDLKPANILLQTEITAEDTEERRENAGACLPLRPSASSAVKDFIPKITDFGLAKRVDKAGDTATGEILGTPSYMAPEQAEPRTAKIDRRSDVYSLGAMLYEMLTGRPPFQSTSPLETLDQVRCQEPVPPRRLNPAVARDLETICLKCLRKEPSGRYASAANLADDLRRFQRGEPTWARPVGAVEHCWGWCRRHPSVAILAAALTLAVAGGLVASLLLWRRAVAGENQALANLRSEEAAHKEAEDNFAMIRDLLNENFRFAGLSFLLQTPNGILVPTNLLLKAEACYASLLRKRDQDPELRRLYASTLRLLGQITLDKGDRSEALALLEKSARLFEHLPTERIRDPDSQAEASFCYLFLGVAHEQSGNRESASRALETSFRLWHALSDEQPSADDRSDAFFTGVELARYLLRFGHSEEDILGRFERCRRRQEAPDNAPACELIRDLLLPVARWQSKQASAVQRAESLAASREVATILERFFQHMPSDRKARLSVNRCSILMSMFLRKGDALDESSHLLEQANRDLEKLCQEEPTGHYYFRELSRSWFEIGKTHWQKNETDDTLTAYRRALEAQQQAIALAPSVHHYRDELGTYHARLGRKYCELGRLDEAENCFQERQALWPGDFEKHEEVLRELRKWAKEVGDGKKDLSPGGQQERQRYLDLCARLERKGIGKATRDRRDEGRRD